MFSAIVFQNRKISLAFFQYKRYNDDVKYFEVFLFYFINSDIRKQFMEIRNLITFTKVAETQSLSKAAAALGYAQSTVTMQMQQLEQELGIHLFDRIGKQTVLTHQGEIFYQHAVSIMKEVSCALSSVAETREITGVLNIGTIESICATIFPELLELFHERWPKVTFSITLDSPEVLMDRLDKNSLDLVYLLDQRIFDPKWKYSD